MSEPAPPVPPRSLTDQAIAALRKRIAMASPRAAGQGSYALSLALLAATPLVTAIAAETCALMQDRRNAIEEVKAGPRMAARQKIDAVETAKADIAPLLTRPTITDLSARLAGALPDGTHLHAIEATSNGAIHAEIDCNDPDALRDALQQDDMLRQFRVVGQAPADYGVRVTLASSAS